MRREFINSTEFIVLIGLFSLLCEYSVFGYDYPELKEYTTTHWHEVGQSRLRKALESQKSPPNSAKNLVLFVGDGLGTTIVTAARVYRAQTRQMQSDQTPFHFEKFPFTGISKTNDIRQIVPDSASSMTAMATGSKVQTGTLGVAPDVLKNDCQSSKLKHINGIAQWALSQGKSVGLVTTTRVTHATPAAMYAHSANRDWENDGIMLDHAASDNITLIGCKDIAKQLIEDFPGKDFSVILGGGLRNFVPHVTNSTSRGRADNRTLTDEWKANAGSGESRAVVTNRDELMKVTQFTDKVLGLFSSDHLPFEIDRNKSEMPSLQEMASKAIEILAKNTKGYVLLVEGGRIDHALHANLFRLAAEEVIAFDDAIQLSASKVAVDETLIVSTADHSHNLNIMGYFTRNLSILEYLLSYGFMDVEVTDGLPKPILAFGDGPGSPFGNGSSPTFRRNLTGMSMDAIDFAQDSLYPRSYSSHGGEDVAIYAKGPASSLFTGLMENSDIAHILAYALCIGPSKNICEKDKERIVIEQLATQNNLVDVLVAVLVLVIICLLLILLTVGILVYRWQLVNPQFQKKIKGPLDTPSFRNTSFNPSEA